MIAIAFKCNVWGKIFKGQPKKDLIPIYFENEMGYLGRPSPSGVIYSFIKWELILYHKLDCEPYTISWKRKTYFNKLHNKTCWNRLKSNNNVLLFSSQSLFYFLFFSTTVIRVFGPWGIPIRLWSFKLTMGLIINLDSHI